MNLKLEFNSLVKQPFDEQWFQKVFEEAFFRVGCKELQHKTLALSLAIVDDLTMQKLNLKLRNKNVSTDVLSIGDYSDEKNILEEQQEEIFLGEIFLSYEFIQESARIDDIEIEYELIDVFSHGILHLLGYQHSEEMFTIQKSVCEAFDD